MYATVTLSRDPFARADLVRREVPHVPGGCAWCGGANRRGNLYQYGVDDDQRPGRAFTPRPFYFFRANLAFCSKGCFESYTECDLCQTGQTARRERPEFPTYVDAAGREHAEF